MGRAEMKAFDQDYESRYMQRRRMAMETPVRSEMPEDPDSSDRLEAELNHRISRLGMETHGKFLKDGARITELERKLDAQSKLIVWLTDQGQQQGAQLRRQMETDEAQGRLISLLQEQTNDALSEKVQQQQDQIEAQAATIDRLIKHVKGLQEIMNKTLAVVERLPEVFK